jgi:3-isopropylmalate dehydrogenase
MSEHAILLTPGDGVGPEVVAEAVKVLQAVGRRFARRFRFVTEHVGGAALERHGVALRDETLAAAERCEAVLFGAVGDPRFERGPLSARPEQAILGLRRGLGLYANLRPVKGREVAGGPFRAGFVAGVDLVVVRELTGGVYFAQPKRGWQDEKGRHAVDTVAYDEHEIRRLLVVAFELATQRRKHVTSVDKANGLETSRLWRAIAEEVAAEHPQVRLEHMLVDACAMQLLRRPRELDVVATENMFGDILTDEAAMLGGSLGMMPSASLGARSGSGGTFGLYEPIHGSAPDIAGRDVANPIGSILSAAMLLRQSLGLETEARAVEHAVELALVDGVRTADIHDLGTRCVGTAELGSAVAERIGRVDPG